jgi:hypothetical protein
MNHIFIVAIAALVTMIEGAAIEVNAAVGDGFKYDERNT